jgi:ribosomal protein S18 acetylase RimI-like enzyme
MASEETLFMKLTTNQEDFDECASMMAKTDPWLTLALNYQQCVPAFEGLGKEVYLLKKGNEIIGFAILQVCGTFKGYIQTLCVREKYRGNGFGKKILLFCEERIIKISPNIFICVSSFNKGAIKLYDELGFKLVGKLDNFVKDGFTELLLRKTFGPMIP